MGYYTDFNISDNSAEIQTAIEAKSGYSFYDGRINAKWYSCEEDCLAISKTFPDDLITVSGDGEEARDMWVMYFKDGKSQKAKAKITFEPFDERKLK